QPESTTSPRWTLFTNGASSTEGSGDDLVLTDLNVQEVTYALRFNFKTSNDEAGYEALINGLELAVHMEVQHLQVFSDSLLITNQVKGIYEAKESSHKRSAAYSLLLISRTRPRSTSLAHIKAKRGASCPRPRDEEERIDQLRYERRRMSSEISALEEEVSRLRRGHSSRRFR
ncbi:reverse transcriptase domain-containing protein, partial [Tanacetum coccineum]